MKLIMTIFFTLILALPALAEDPQPEEQTAQTGQTAATPQGADPCDSERAEKGGTPGQGVKPQDTSTAAGK